MAGDERTGIIITGAGQEVAVIQPYEALNVFLALRLEMTDKSAAI